MKNERRLADGRVELIDTQRVEASLLYNEDLAPVPLSRRNWTTYNYAAVWVSMAHCIPTYMLASGLLASGMNWSQALITILLGNTIVLIPSSSTRIQAPSTAFLSGVRPRRVRHARLERAGVDARAGRLRLVRHPGVDRRRSAQVFFKTVIPGWPTLLGAGVAGHTTTEWLSFLLFWG
jgi:NCS1 family nucleobase:cation symporter-1